MIIAALGTCAVLFLVMVVCLIAQNEKPLPRPRADERSWSINYMTDFKRWSGRG